MIIFDLDGTLANCEHRRHFVDPTDNDNECFSSECNCKPWKPNWKAFYEACNKDEPILATIQVLASIAESNEYGTDTPFVDWEGIEIWSGRCESVRGKTEKWLKKHLILNHSHYGFPKLKMRPIGDNTPDDQLKEKWLDEALANGETIDMVFDDRPKVVRMWRRRGIFVFNCCQHDQEF